MCLLFETICIKDGVPQHLAWHKRRIDLACRELWPAAVPVDPGSVIVIPDEFSKGLVRCKIVYGRGVRKISFSIYSPRAISSLRLVESDIDYHLKYDDRKGLDSLFALREDADEIIIVKKGLVTDTSMSNLVFFDGADWITPKKPLLKGTCRDRLLAAGQITEMDIRPADLGNFIGCKLINAMRDLTGEGMIPVSKIF
jgi:4-amino-4-deoxychorismate lyase